MSSKYVKDLYSLATALDEEGKIVSAAIARDGADRMDRMETLIVDHDVGKVENEL